MSLIWLYSIYFFLNNILYLIFWWIFNFINQKKDSKMLILNNCCEQYQFLVSVCTWTSEQSDTANCCDSYFDQPNIVVLLVPLTIVFTENRIIKLKWNSEDDTCTISVDYIVPETRLQRRKMHHHSGGTYPFISQLSGDDESFEHSTSGWRLYRIMKER
mgnify:CR=1 FL=1